MRTKGLIALLVLAVITVSSFAQENEKRFGFEFNSGVSMATNELEGSALNPGFGFEGIFHYRFISHLGAYAGWGWNRLGADESFAGNDVCFEETGYVLGLQFKQPLGGLPLQFYVRAGGLYNHIETENSEGDIINDTGHGLGWQLAAGIDLSVGKNWSLTPGVKFNSLNRNSDFNGVERELKYNYVSLRIGIVKHF